MDLVDFQDIVNGFSGQTQWRLSRDTLDKVQSVHGESPLSPWTKSVVTSQSGQFAWIRWILSMDSLDSLDIVSGHPGLFPGVQKTGQSPCTKSTESMNFLYKRAMYVLTFLRFI